MRHVEQVVLTVSLLGLVVSLVLLVACHAYEVWLRVRRARALLRAAERADEMVEEIKTEAWLRRLRR